MTGDRGWDEAARPIAEGALCVVAALYVPLALLAPHGLAPLLIVAAVALVVGPNGRGILARAWREPLTVLFAGVVTLGAASALWAPDPGIAMTRAAKLTGLYVAVVVFVFGVPALEPRHARKVEMALIAGLIAGLLLFLVEWATRGAITRIGRDFISEARPWRLFQLDRGIGTMVLILWPGLLILWRRGFRGGAVVLAAVAAAAVSTSASLAAGIALTAGAATLVLVRAAGSRVTTVIAVAVVAGVMAAPLIPSLVLTPERINVLLPGAKPSGLHRGYIWRFTSERIAEKPVSGWGLDASRYVPGGDRKVPQNLRTMPEDNRLMSLHPHNWPLQAWLELGLPGAALLALLVVIVRMSIRRLADDRAIQAAAAAAFASAIVLALLSWGLWQSWWIAGLGMAAGLVGLAARHVPTGPAPGS